MGLLDDPRVGNILDMASGFNTANSTWRRDRSREKKALVWQVASNLMRSFMADKETARMQDLDINNAFVDATQAKTLIEQKKKHARDGYLEKMMIDEGRDPKNKKDVAIVHGQRIWEDVVKDSPNIQEFQSSRPTEDYNMFKTQDTWNNYVKNVLGTKSPKAISLQKHLNEAVEYKTQDYMARIQGNEVLNEQSIEPFFKVMGDMGIRTKVDIENASLLDLISGKIRRQVNLRDSTINRFRQQFITGPMLKIKKALAEIEQVDPLKTEELQEAVAKLPVPHMAKVPKSLWTKVNALPLDWMKDRVFDNVHSFINTWDEDASGVLTGEQLQRVIAESVGLLGYTTITANGEVLLRDFSTRVSRVSEQFKDSPKEKEDAIDLLTKRLHRNARQLVGQEASKVEEHLRGEEYFNNKLDFIKTTYGENFSNVNISPGERQELKAIQNTIFAQGYGQIEDKGRVDILMATITAAIKDDGWTEGDIMKTYDKILNLAIKENLIGVSINELSFKRMIPELAARVEEHIPPAVMNSLTALSNSSEYLESFINRNQGSGLTSVNLDAKPSTEGQTEALQEMQGLIVAVQKDQGKPDPVEASTAKNITWPNRNLIERAAKAIYETTEPFQYKLAGTREKLTQVELERLGTAVIMESTEYKEARKLYDPDVGLTYIYPGVTRDLMTEILEKLEESGRYSKEGFVVEEAEDAEDAGTTILDKIITPATPTSGITEAEIDEFMRDKSEFVAEQKDWRTGEVSRPKMTRKQVEDRLAARKEMFRFKTEEGEEAASKYPRVAALKEQQASLLAKRESRSELKGIDAIEYVSSLFKDKPHETQFLKRLAEVESKMGTDSNTYNIVKDEEGRIGSYGLMQIDRIAFDEIQRRLTGTSGAPKKIQKWIRPVQAALGVDLREVNYEDLNNDTLNVIFSRLYLKTITSKPIPESRKEQGKYWKKFYNTPEGKGSASDF